MCSEVITMTSTMTCLLSIYAISLLLCIWFVFGYFRTIGVSIGGTITSVFIVIVPGLNTFAVLAMAATFCVAVKKEIDRQANAHERVMAKTKKHFG